MYQITGRTYDAKDDLKKAGYVYSSETKSWIGESREPFDAMIAKWKRHGYGVRFGQLAKQLHIDEFAIVTCEI